MTRVPEEAFAALHAVEAVLGRAPVAAILSGSAVEGGLRPLSDVDLLVVVEDAPDAAARVRLAAALMTVSGRYGAGGSPRPLDVTLVVRGDVVPWRYPPTRAFAYGEWLRAAYEAGAGPAPGPHPDLAVVLAQARAIGVALLTLARMWHTAATGAFAPKDAAAAWAAARLPADLATWLELAGRAYVGEAEDDWRDHRVRAAAVAERLRREVERAGGAPGTGGPVRRG